MKKILCDKCKAEIIKEPKTKKCLWCEKNTIPVEFNQCDECIANRKDGKMVNMLTIWDK